MLRLRRPPMPETFEQDVENARAAAQAEIKRYRSELDQKKPKPTKPDFPQIWGRYKAAFAEAQHEKCGYCEVRVIAGFNGDVEHFRPKGEVWSLSDNPADWGEQRPHSASVTGRKHEIISDTGYWWMAYDWGNWLLSCSACNSGWKGSFFPVAEANRVLPPAENEQEQPLLLNPFDGPDPIEHLYFGDLGEVQPENESRLGRETIKVCGLDRASLRLARLEKAQRANQLVHEIRTAATDDIRIRALRAIFQMGNEAYDHAGMVRAIFQTACAVSWYELEAVIQALE